MIAKQCVSGKEARVVFDISRFWHGSGQQMVGVRRNIQGTDIMNASGYSSVLSWRRLLFGSGCIWKTVRRVLVHLWCA